MNSALSTQHLRRRRLGFTLIELLVVISIIGILLGSAVASWTNAQQKGRDGRRKSDLKAVQQAVELYFQNNGKYPGSASGQIRCNQTGASPNDDKVWGGAFTCGGTTYMQVLPKDPKDQAAKGYYYNNPSTTAYNLWAALENTSDPDLTSLPPSCGGWAPQNRNWCVVNP